MNQSQTNTLANALTALVSTATPLVAPPEGSSSNRLNDAHVVEIRNASSALIGKTSLEDLLKFFGAPGYKNISGSVDDLYLTANNGISCWVVGSTTTDAPAAAGILLHIQRYRASTARVVLQIFFSTSSSNNIIYYRLGHCTASTSSAEIPVNWNSWRQISTEAV